MSASRPSTVSIGLPVCRYESPTILEAESPQDLPVPTGLASAAVLKIFSSSSIVRAPPRACKQVVSHGCIAWKICSWNQIYTFVIQSPNLHRISSTARFSSGLTTIPSPRLSLAIIPFSPVKIVTTPISEAEPKGSSP